MKFRINFFNLAFLAILGLPIQVFAEYEWCPIVKDPGKYQIVIEGVSCPVRQARYKDRVLKVDYDCLTPTGARHGKFTGRQISDTGFRGQNFVQSSLGHVNTHLEINFMSPETVTLKSRGKQYSASIALLEAE